MLAMFKRLPAIIYAWVEPNIRQYLKTRQPIMWFMALVIGISVSIAAIIFRELIGYIQLLWLGDSSERVATIAATLPWYVVFLAPVIGGAIVGFILTNYLPMRRTGGVADVIEARAPGGRRIEFKQALTSLLATTISLGSGASAGREGPMVHLGSAISTSVSSWFKLPDSCNRTLLACGVASAVSASFNAPLAGVLFAHEVILGHYAMRAFVPIVISSVAGTIFSRLWFGDVAAFDIPAYQITSLWEFPAFVILGIVCAIVSILFQFAIVASEAIARNIEIPLWTRPMIGGALIGAMAIFLPEILGVGYETTDLALKNQLPLMLMFLLIFAKTIATAITVASRFGGGFFSPALYLGAMTGGTFGLIAAQAFPDMASSGGLYAILGMGAVAAAVLGAPISTTMIVFELTGGYTLTIALLLVVSIANGINHAIHGHSIFQWQLETRGLFMNDGPSRYLLRTTRVREFMNRLEANEDDKLLREGEEELVFLISSDTLESALRSFDTGSHERLPVVDETNTEKIIGWATQVHALRYLNSELIKISEEEHEH